MVTVAKNIDSIGNTVPVRRWKLGIPQDYINRGATTVAQYQNPWPARI